MNKILQQRIEEAATFLFKQRGLDKESCRQAMDYILANQWISVDEALPEADKHGYSEKVLVRQKFNPDDIVVATYNHNAKKWNHISPITIHDLQVTHWMEIPSLKGGEK